MRGEDNPNQSFFTLQKILQYPEPPGYRINTPRTNLKIAPFLECIAQINDTGKSLPKKQQHTAKRIKEECYYGKYTQVKKAVREIRRIKREVFMSFIHRPGEAQVDFGNALATILRIKLKRNLSTTLSNFSHFVTKSGKLLNDGFRLLQSSLSIAAFILCLQKCNG